MLGLGVGLDDAGQGPVARLIRDGAVWAGDFRTQLYYADNEPVQIAGLLDLTNYRNSAAWRINTAGSLIAYAAGVPRVADGSLLVEGASTGLTTHSADQSQSVWGVELGLTKGAVQTDSPLSGQIAQRFELASGNGRVSQSIASFNTSTRSVVMICRPTGDHRYAGARLPVGTGNAYKTCGWDLDNLTSAASASEFSEHEVVELSGGYYFCRAKLIPTAGNVSPSSWFFFVSNVINANPDAFTAPTTTDPYDLAYVDAPLGWPAQIVISGATAATVAAEVPLAKQGSGPIPYPGYVDGPGFLTATFKNVAATAANRTVLSLSDGTTDEQVKVHVDASDDLILTANTAAGTPATATIASGIDLASGGTVAVAYDGTNVRASCNGGAVATAAKVLDTSALTELHVACDEAGAEQLNGEIVSTDAGDGTLTDAQLQAKAQ